MLMLILITSSIATIIALFSLIVSIVEHNFKWAVIWTLCLGFNVICLVSTLDNLDKLYSQTNNVETSKQNAKDVDEWKTNNVEMSKPNAKDVYEGKTTLRIVYEDSIPVDTIVVFKKDFR